MKKYILTGAPGSGKTSIIRALEMRNYAVIEEAATDIIAYEQSQGVKEPWKNKDFINKIAALQKHREQQAKLAGTFPLFCDRSLICTYALALFLEIDPPAALLEDIPKMREDDTLQREVFFIENLGFIKNTEARQISFEETLRFEQIHREAYEKFGFSCISIKPSPILKRADNILALVCGNPFV